MPFGTLVAILALWFCISVPLTFIGAYFGFKKAVSSHKNIWPYVSVVLFNSLFCVTFSGCTHADVQFSLLSAVIWLFKGIEHPVRTNQIPRQIPEQSFYTKPFPGIVMGGILPFGCIFIQLFFILNSIWWEWNKELVVIIHWKSHYIVHNLVLPLEFSLESWESVQFYTVRAVAI